MKRMLWFSFLLITILPDFGVKGFEFHSNNNIMNELRGKMIENIFNISTISSVINDLNRIPRSNNFSVDCDSNQDGGQQEKLPRIQIPNLGTARGTFFTSFFGKRFLGFLSIPYAKPPVGDLRFKMPEPWEGEWDTTENGIEGDYDATFLKAKCPQWSLIVPTAAGREDCLFLSIYTPDEMEEKKEKKYPVMFYIHGGGFVIGDASLYVPTKLMDQDVVVVVVQYRLGSLGFLGSQTPENPGNMGLMDQILALRWVQKYISYFGGDPDYVTVFGQSAGAASASWLQLSNRTKAENNSEKQLFHRAIFQSGTALDVWSQNHDPHQSFINTAKGLKCWNQSDDTSVQTALDCMRELAANDIITTYVHASDKNSWANAPIIQKELLTNYPEEIETNPDLLVISGNPINIIMSKDYLQIPVIIGTLRDEGSMVLAGSYTEVLEPNGYDEDEFFLKHEFIPDIVASYGIKDATGAVSSSLKLTFLKFAEMGNWDSMSGGLVDMTGMLNFKSTAWSLAQLLTLTNSEDLVYFYSFEFESDDTFFKWLFPPDIPIEGGITHADELIYFFYLPSMMDERQRSFIRAINSFWTTFAANGKPSYSTTAEEFSDSDDWKPVSLENLEFMLMMDRFQMSNDFTLRWNYNTIPDPSCS